MLEALPYRKDDLTATYRPEYVRLRDEYGYAVARVDVRGTGSSDGLAVDEYPAQEQRDLCDVIAWLAEQPWCTGAVGMYGTSYSGFNSLQVACERPPALKAIIAIYATDDRYTDDVHYMGGLAAAARRRRLPGVHGRDERAAAGAGARGRRVAGRLARPGWTKLEPWLLRWLEEQRDSAYWRHGSLRPAYDRIECPTMLVGGWADGYRNNTFRTMTGPGRAGHAAPAAARAVEPHVDGHALPGPHVDLVPVMARWWDRWLRGIDDGYDDEPALTWFQQASTLPAPDRRVVDGEWRRRRPGRWPGARHDVRPLGEGEVSYAVLPDVGTAAWNSCAGALPWGQPTDQRYDDAASLTWEWPADASRAARAPRLRLRAPVERPGGTLSAKLCDVFPDGTSSLLTRGLLNLTHRSSSTAPEPMPVGRVGRRRHRARGDGLDAVAGSPAAAVGGGRRLAEHRRPAAAGDADASTVGVALLLPVGGEWLPAPHLDVGTAPAVGGRRTRRRRHLAGRARRARPDHVGAVDHGSAYEVDVGRVREHYSGSVQVDTRTFDQRAEATAEFEVAWPEGTVVARTDITLRAGPSAYDVEIDVRTTLDGEPFADRHWTRSIPRDLA